MDSEMNVSLYWLSKLRSIIDKEGITDDALITFIKWSDKEEKRFQERVKELMEE